MTRIMVAGGGTGGHVFPGLAVARELQAIGVEVHWLGVAGGIEAELVGKRGLPVTLLELGELPPGDGEKGTWSLTRLPKAVAASARILLDLQPKAVLGVGGYVSLVGLLAAGLVGIPCVLQEQNSTPGATNRFLAPWADLICCGFVDAARTFSSLPAEWTGNPVRRDFFEVPGVELHGPPQLLVLGGRQGALFLNRILPRALAQLHQDGVTPKVRHQAGVRWAEVVRTSYQDLNLDAQVHAFLAEPWQALASADLVVARSGALTVSELAAAGRGAVLIPFAVEGRHQELNARSLERAGGAIVIDESDATPRRIAQVLRQLLSNRDGLVAMGRNIRAMALPDSARRIAGRLLAVGGAA